MLLGEKIVLSEDSNPTDNIWENYGQHTRLKNRVWLRIKTAMVTLMFSFVVYLFFSLLVFLNGKITISNQYPAKRECEGLVGTYANHLTLLKDKAEDQYSEIMRNQDDFNEKNQEQTVASHYEVKEMSCLCQAQDGDLDIDESL
jgi:hypothetical protein